MILLVDKIEKSFGARVLFSGASFQINPGERFALVGPNGAGKTTMLKIIMGIDSPDSGQVQYAKDCQVGYLEQETNLEHKDTTILAEVMAAAKEIRRMGERANELQAQITELSEQGKDVEALLNEYGKVQDRFEHLGGYELESNARKILSGLGFKVTDFERPCSEFSGGWQMRIALAKLFLRHPDLLLLDEPTNHLDLESVQWLRGFIANYDGAVLIVSHDRAFMDACVDHVAALENRRVTTYTGNYSSYLKQREDNLEQMRAKRAAQERDIAHMQVFVDKFRYKPTKAAQAQERIRKIEQIKKELVILPEGHKHIDFKFPDPPRSGDMVVGLEGVSKSYGNKHIYSDIDLKLYRGEHVALVGPNGAGKSTLMKIIAGLEPPTTGTRDLGTNVGVAYYAQHALEGMTESNTVLQEIDTVTPKWTVPQQRSLLGAFLFSDNDAIEKQVRVLSGGEKARLALAKMLVAPEALLCLDEPTNHLDIDSVDMLENALQNFPGTIVLISHDEHLVRAFNGGEDFHAETAARVFGVPVSEVTPDLRSRAKAVNFGIVYGQQAYGLSQSLHISMAEARDMIDRYYEAYPGVRTFLDNVVARAKQTGYAETMYGRRRHIPELKAKNPQLRGFGERTAMNHPMQGTAADIIKIAMARVSRRLEEEGFAAHMILQVHDELDFECPVDEVERLTAMVRDVMEHVVDLRVPLIAEASTGITWADAK